MQYLASHIQSMNTKHFERQCSRFFIAAAAVAAWAFVLMLCH